MKSIYLSLLVAVSCYTSAWARDAEDTSNLVILTETQMKNAKLKTEEPVVGDFETTLFTIGRIQAIPSMHTVISSRIAGRSVSRPPIVGDFVRKGQTVLKVESNQPGSPPPTISLKAPADGYVFESHISLGEPVETSEELMDLVDLDQVWAVANIPESQAHRVSIGQESRIRVVSLGDKVFTGKLIRFGTQANIESNSVEAIFLLENKDHALRPNMLTEFYIVTDVRKDVFSVSTEAIQGDTLNAHVFKKDYELDRTFEKIPVVIGQQNGERTELILQDNELSIVDDVVVHGGYLLSHTSTDKTSLKEALDAAHGHEHNEDGSEITAEQKQAKNNQQGDAGGGGASSEVVMMLVISNAVTLILLIVTIFRKKDVS